MVDPLNNNADDIILKFGVDYEVDLSFRCTDMELKEVKGRPIVLDGEPVSSFMGLIEYLTVYLWNWFVSIQAISGLYICWNVGVWGLFWSDDDGKLTNECLKLWKGNNVSFPVSYQEM